MRHLAILMIAATLAIATVTAAPSHVVAKRCPDGSQSNTQECIEKPQGSNPGSHDNGPPPPDPCAGIPGIFHGVCELLNSLCFDQQGNFIPCPQPVATPTISDVLNQLIVAGTVDRYPRPPASRKDPSQVDGLVNVPMMYYIIPPTITDRDTHVTATIDGARTRAWKSGLLGGAFIVNVNLQSVDWDFGDGAHQRFLGLSPSTDFSSAFGQNVHPPGGTSTVSHSYDHTGTFPVMATENWLFTVTNPGGQPLTRENFTIIAQSSDHSVPPVMVTFPDGSQRQVWPEYVRVDQLVVVPVG